MCSVSCVLQSGSCGLLIKLLLRNDIIRPQATNLRSFCYFAINMLLRINDFRKEMSA